jgi:ribosomal protein S18 acetylase RimI-like enzyme
MANIAIRLAAAADVGFLWDVLVEVAKAPYYRRTRTELLADPGVRHYLEGWPHDTDVGVIATESAGGSIGAAWLRQFTEADQADGFVGEGIPELAIGVLAEHRGRGVGKALMQAIAEAARRAGLENISLSVDRPNPAVVLYRSAGYRVVHESAHSYVMLLDLVPDTAAR